MTATDLNLAGPLRDALIANGDITALLGTWEGEASIHTRRPVPDGAGYPMGIVNPDVSIGDRDWLTSRRPIVTRDIVWYGQQPGQYRDVEALGYLTRDLFHRKRFSITVPGFHVMQIIASGPHVAPTDDEKTVARAVSLSIHLEALA